MAATFVQNRAADQGIGSFTSAARAFASNVGSGNLLFVYIWAGGAGAAGGTDDTDQWTCNDTLTNSYTRLAHSAESTFNAGTGTGSKHAIFACISGSGGANTITIGFPSAVNFTRMIIWEWTGTATPVASAIPSSAADSAAHLFLEAPYFYRTSTTASDPGSGNLRLNNATLSSVTAAYFDQFDANTVDRTSFLSTLAIGSTLRFYQNGSPTNYVDYTVTSVTDNTGWFTIGLSYVGVGGTIPQTDNSAWWAHSYGIVMPAVTTAVDGRVAAAVQDLNGGGTGYTAGSGYGNLINTVSDGKCGSEDKATSSVASVMPWFSSDNSIAQSFGISWAIAPAAAANKQTSYYSRRRSVRR